LPGCCLKKTTYSHRLPAEKARPAPTTNIRSTMRCMRLSLAIDPFLLRALIVPPCCATPPRLPI
jgi:hypothetical protein